MSKYSPTDQQYLVAFGLRVKSARIDKGLTQEQLADATGLHRTYIGSAERGERNVSVLNLHKIADALDIGVSKLLTDE